MKRHGFRESIKKGKRGEEALKKFLHNRIFITDVEIVRHNGVDIFSTMLQRKGVDGLIRNKEVKWDSKIRAFRFYEYRDILLETVSVIETGKLGWFYSSIADFIIYTWKNEKGTYIIDGYLVFIQNPILKKWFEENKHKYRQIPAETEDEDTGEIWHTKSILVPIVDFPKGTILRFKPNIALEKQDVDLTDQLDLFKT